MLNHVILVGRIAQQPELHLTESGKKKSQVTIAVPRNYKNQNGEYETDFLDCILWTSVAETTNEYCKVGDVVGVKGRLQTRMIEKEDGNKYKKVEIVAEKVSFLSSSKNVKEQELASEDVNKEEDKNVKQCQKNNKNSKKKN